MLFAGILRAFLAFWDLLLLPLRLPLRLAGRLRDGTWLTVTLEGPLVDVAPARRRFAWLAPLTFRRGEARPVALERLDALVRRAVREPRVRGIVVTIPEIRGGLANATSLRDVLGRARAGGKTVVAVLPRGGGSKETYVACAADRVVLGPAAQLAPFGFRVATRYLKTVLARVGIEPQVFAHGEFKSAGETLVRDTMSPPQRAQVDRLLETFHGALADAIASGRGFARARAEAMIDGAPYFGEAAREAGLVDDVAYEDEVPGKLGTTRASFVDGFAWLAREERPLVRPVRPRPVALVIPVHGPIAHASGPFGDLATDERVTRMVRAARTNPLVRGVILHVDSPGGGALASDIMHHEIDQLAREKPVVACFANVAASGGYYVAAPARVIVAQETTMTGSIGVVAARFSLEPLLARLGIRTEVVARGARAELLSPIGPLDGDARATIERELDATYRAFVGVVAKGRRMAVADVERLARGRVYTGRDAYDVGLVDRLGGFDVALEELRKLAGRDLRVATAPTDHAPRPLLAPPPLPANEALWLRLAGERILALAPSLEI